MKQEEGEADGEKVGRERRKGEMKLAIELMRMEELCVTETLLLWFLISAPER